MTHYPDLSPYTYHSEIEMDGDVVNIGWLDSAHAFPKGGVTDAFLERLWAFCRLSVLYTRGFHVCNVCETMSYLQIPTIERGDESLEVGDAELLVFGSKDRIYAAPNLIYHYIIRHHYQPPTEFIEAVLKSPLPDSPEYDAKINKFSWWQYDKQMHTLILRQSGRNG